MLYSSFYSTISHSIINQLNKYNYDNIITSIDELKKLFQKKLSKPLFFKMGFKNFKAFGDKLQTFLIKPITLIYAPNSVGKSSFIHNIIHLHYFLQNHLKEKVISLDKVNIYGDEIDLGGFESYIHKRNLNNHIYYKLEVKNPILPLLQSKGYNKSYIDVEYFFVNLIEEFDKYKPILFLLYDLLQKDIDILEIKNNIKEEFTKEEIEYQIYMRLKLSLLMIDNKEELYDYIKDNYIKNVDIYHIEDNLIMEHFIFNNRHKSIYKVGDMEFEYDSSIDSKIDNLKFFDEIIIQNTIQYIGPLRFYPDRNFIFEDIKGDEYKSYNSKELWALLKTKKKLLKDLNSWLSNKDKLKSHYEIIIKDDKIFFKDKRMDTIVSNKDLGLGISQILPILISSYFLKEKTIIIEQPELHLHPAVQAELADEIIKGYKNAGNRYFIESHSEYLLLRIMRRMRYLVMQKENRDEKLDISNNDISLLYIDADEKNTYVLEMELASDGTLLDPWPGGFFEEGFKERFE